jgi:ATP-dependent DNA helicase RecG
MSSDAAPKSAVEVLATPVQFLKGVGEERAKLLRRLELHTLRDVLFFFPRDYQDLSDLRALDELQEGQPASVRGVVVEIDQKAITNGVMLGVLVQVGDDFLRAVWFNQSYLLEKLTTGQNVMFYGRPKLRGQRWEMNHPKLTTLDNPDDQPECLLQPIYPLTEGLKQYQIRRVVADALAAHLDVLDEVFPAELLAKYGLATLHQALPQIHFPKNHAELDEARRRLVFQELYILQLALSLRRYEQESDCRAPELPVTAKIDARIRRLLPFELTAGQRQAIAEISADLARDRPMNRLLQGDVGSGKTVIAVYAMMAAVAHGQQAALMAPTEVLARQHAQVLGRTLAKSRVRIGLLTGGLTASERKETLAAISEGEIDLVVGTQAIVQSGVEFHKLGLVVIDEQHKFGVRQRAALRHAGLDPHYLVMTATPIPRTVAMTAFGDLEVSTLRDRPPGRQPVLTYLVDADKIEAWWEFVRKKLREGRQAFVITPLVEETEDSSLENVMGSYEDLANGELADFQLDIIHGRLNARDKEAAMQAFREGKTQVLVSTSVVEVGVDVPNATVMTIQGAERFGLAQLHQLRGRVSRGQSPGYCGVMADPQTDAARARLDALAGSSDGFELAEIDFQLRGPGDLLGTRQHGLPPLRIADLVRDADVLVEARAAAQELIASDAGLSQPEHAPLRRMAMIRYGKVLELGDVG